MTWPHGLGLVPKLTLLIIAIGLLPLGLLGFLAIHTANAALTSAAGQQLQATAVVTAAMIDRAIYERVRDLQGFVRAESAQLMESDRLISTINTHMTTHAPVYRLMIVADLTGTIIAVNTVDENGSTTAATRGLLGLNVSGERWFQEAVRSGSDLSGAVVGDAEADPLVMSALGTRTNEVTLSLSAPIRTKDGRVVGVWSNRLKWDMIRTLVNNSEQRAQQLGSTTTRLALANRQGMALVVPFAEAGPRPSLAGRESLASAPVIASGYTHGQALSGSQAALEAWAFSPGYASFRGLGWTVIATQDRAEALAAADHLQRLLLLVGAVAVGVIVAVAWIVAVRIVDTVRPVAAVIGQIANHDLPAFTTAVHAWAAGNLTHELEFTATPVLEEGDNELGDLGRNVNQLIDGLSTVHQALQTLTTNLQTLRGATQALFERKTG